MKTSQDIQGDSDKLARERTDLAQQRNVLANERTLSAWLRTGLAAMVTGLGIARLLGSGGSLLIARSIGAILILTGGAIYIIALRHYCSICQRLEQENMRAMPNWLLNALVAAFLLSSLLAFVLVFQG